MIVLGSHGISWLQTGKNVAEEQDGGHVVSRLLRSNLVTGRSRLVVNEKVASYGERIHVYTVYPYSGYPDRHAPSGLLV